MVSDVCAVRSPVARVMSQIPRLVHELPRGTAEQAPERIAYSIGKSTVSYGTLSSTSAAVAGGFVELGLRRFDRIAIYLPKVSECVLSMTAASRAGCAFVPINPILKPDQVIHILRDSGAKALVTSSARAQSLVAGLRQCPDLDHLVLTDGSGANEHVKTRAWSDLIAAAPPSLPRVLENDMAAILYTSGSTGKPKGVVLSHRNIVVGALSVASYLNNTKDDRILSILPLSFDAGMSQLTTAFSVGARISLLDYLLPRDAVQRCESDAITGITGVPPLWMQLVQQDWPVDATRNVRYFANTGGRMPRDTLSRLRATFANAKPYLMYGLTEAFRSTYLPPEQADRRPDSIGKAIPNVEIHVVRPDGSACGVDEPGELVHRGPLVSLGYWNDAAKTAERFRPAPGQPSGIQIPEIAVWSGDTVKYDDEGYLYFIGRQDDMIKTSGYRVSPTEIEEVAFESGLVKEAVALGLDHPTLGQAIVLVASHPSQSIEPTDELLKWYRSKVPQYMVPARIDWVTELPRNANGKIDRTSMKSAMATLFAEGNP